MDAPDGIATKIAIAVIVAVLVYFAYKWWKGQSVEKLEVPAAQPMPMPTPPPQDPVPQGPGVTMYLSLIHI
jgi:hypothetical protein